MANSTPIAEFFARIGIKADTRQLDILLDQMKQLVAYTRQLRSAMKNSFKVRTDYSGLVQMRNSLGAATGQVRLLRAEIERLKRTSANANVSASVRGGVRGAGGGGGLGGSGMGSGRFGFGAGMGASALVRTGLPAGAAGLFGVDAFQTAAQYQGIEAALTSVTGTAEGARQQFQWLHNEANRVGFVFKENARTYTNFVAAGKSVGVGTEEIQKIFSATAEYGRVLNLSTDDLNGTFRALQQMLSKGTVQSEELKGQLGERLPGAVGLAADAMGVTTEELFKMMEQGKLTAKDLLPKLAIQFKNAANSGGAFAKASTNATAQLARFRTSWDDFKVSFAEGGFLETVSDILQGLTFIFKEIAPYVKILVKVVQMLWRPFEALFKVLWRLLNDVLKPLVPMLKWIGFILLYLTSPLWATWAAFGALMLVIEDFFGLLEGKDSVLGEQIAKGKVWAHILLFVLSVFKRLYDIVILIARALGAAFSFDLSSLKQVMADAKAYFMGKEGAGAQPLPGLGGMPATGSDESLRAFQTPDAPYVPKTQQWINTFNITGTTDPEEIARIVAQKQVEMITNASLDILPVQ